ncbi:MAG: hypothetical protein JXR58_05400 [Bacteroidales bacterium]|nr:hypothetical protein [Bacteroidales bacterium]
MRKLLSIALFIGVTAIIFSSCGKYEEGPGISLKSKAGRLAGTWEYEKMIVDGTEQDISFYSDITTTLEKDGTGKMTWGSLEMELEWEFDDKKENFRARTKNSTTGEMDEWGDWAKILRLTSDEFWITEEETVGGATVVTETHMKKK